MIKDKFYSVKKLFLLKNEQMKPIFLMLLLFFITAACDDGDLTVETIDFSEVNAQKCPQKEIILKLKDTEMLLLEIPSSEFESDITPEDEPTLVPLSETIKVTYRQYNGTVSSNNICLEVPLATPIVTEEWTATSGTIEITTTAVKNVNTTTNATRITGYKHNIVFRNITWQKPSGLQVESEFVFGDYTIPVSALAFGFDEELEKSTCDNRIFDFNGGEAFILDIDDFGSLFENVATTTPRTALISNDNKLTYKLFSNTISTSYFCTTPTPVLPVVNQEWNAINGVAAVSGIIEVTTTQSGNSFIHTILLKKVTLKKGLSDFYLGDEYLYGSLITNP